jgi:hypothetical protein
MSHPVIYHDLYNDHKALQHEKQEFHSAALVPAACASHNSE